MAYNETTANGIREVFIGKEIYFTEKKMFSGICFFIDDKMCCGTHIDTTTNQDFSLCRIGETAYGKAIENSQCIPMDFTGKPMKGYVFVLPEGCNTRKKLNHWLQLCINYNPEAKKSKKK